MKFCWTPKIADNNSQSHDSIPMLTLLRQDHQGTILPNDSFAQDLTAENVNRAQKTYPPSTLFKLASWVLRGLKNCHLDLWSKLCSGLEPIVWWMIWIPTKIDMPSHIHGQDVCLLNSNFLMPIQSGRSVPPALSALPCIFTLVAVVLTNAMTKTTIPYPTHLKKIKPWKIRLKMRVRMSNAVASLEYPNTTCWEYNNQTLHQATHLDQTRY